MSSNNPTQEMVDIFCTNASGVLSTITNNTLELQHASTDDFDFDVVQGVVELPAVLLTINFSGDQNFQYLMLVPKKLVAILADLMMLGDGDVEYIPEEHNDAVQEMFNQVLGSLSSQLSGRSVNLSGTVTQVELTDMEIQKDFLEENKMVRLQIKVLDDDFTLYLFMDNFAETSVKNLFESAEPEEDDEFATAAAQSKGSAAPPPQKHQQQQQPAVPVSRASFSDLDTSAGVSGFNVNIEMLYDIPLDISVELGRKEMKIKEILEMGQGSVIELDKTAGDYVDLIVNGKKFAIGEVMVADENYAVRIVSLVSRQERIKALGR